MSSIRTFFIVTVFLISGCASEVVRYPTDLSAVAPATRKHYVALSAAVLPMESGYNRTINAGTQFVEFGFIKQGKVLKPTNTVLTVEGAHMHEAYPVIDNDRVVGFYLPVEKAYSPLSQAIILSIQEKESVK
jgi:hypothetical protein